MALLNTQLMTSVLFTLIIILGLWGLKTMLAPLVLSVVIAVLMYPVYKKFLKLFKNNRNLAAFCVTLIVLGFILLPIFSLGTILVREIQTVYQTVSELLENTTQSERSTMFQVIIQWASQYGINLENTLRTYVLPGISKTSVLLTALAANAVGIMLGFIIAIVVLFFILRDSNELTQFLKKISPLSEQNTKYFLDTCTNVIQGVLWANILTACAQGILGGIGFAIFQIPSPVFWGMVMFVFSMIPFFGPAFIYGPATLLMFLTTQDLQQSLLYLAFNVLFVSTIDNIIKPLVIGGKVKIHPLITFLAIVGGIRAWGILGIIYGPLVAALVLLVIDIHLRETKQRSLFE